VRRTGADRPAVRPLQDAHLPADRPHARAISARVSSIRRTAPSLPPPSVRKRR
jgi:hypothetical protein